MVEQDPSWELLVQDVPAVVQLLSTLIDDGVLLDHLFSDRRITLSQLTKIQLAKQTKTSTDDVARLLLFDILMKGKKPGSFKAFCNATQKTEGGEDLHAILIRHLPRDIESSAYWTGDELEPTASQPSCAFGNSNSVPQLMSQPQHSRDEIDKINTERRSFKALKVFIVAFCYTGNVINNSEGECTVTAFCSHAEEDKENEEEKYKIKDNWKCSEPWQFPLNDGKGDCTVRIHLVADKNDLWNQKNTIVFPRSALIGSGKLSTRIRAKGRPAKTLHLRGEYVHDGKIVSTHIFTFFLSPSKTFFPLGRATKFLFCAGAIIVLAVGLIRSHRYLRRTLF